MGISQSELVPAVSGKFSLSLHSSLISQLDTKNLLAEPVQFAMCSRKEIKGTSSRQSIHFSVGPKYFSYNISVEIKTENLDHFIVLMHEFLHVAKNLLVELASLVGVQD